MQKYNKRENKKVRKSNLQEIIGDRKELKPFLGKVLLCEVFVTNSIGFLGEKRLLTEVRIPNTNFYIKHLWVKEHNLPINKISHGYQEVRLKVISYEDKINGFTKYGVQIADKNLRKNSNKMIVPQWKLDMIEDEKLYKQVEPPKQVKQPFRKIRKIK